MALNGALAQYAKSADAAQPAPATVGASNLRGTLAAYAKSGGGVAPPVIAPQQPATSDLTPPLTNQSQAPINFGQLNLSAPPTPSAPSLVPPQQLQTQQQPTISAYKAPPENVLQKAGDLVKSFGEALGIVQSPQDAAERTQSVGALTNVINDQPYYTLAQSMGLDKTLQVQYPAGVTAADFTPGTDPYKYKAMVAAGKNAFTQAQQQNPTIKPPDSVSSDYVDQNFDTLTKQMGVRSLPTRSEFAGYMLTGLIPEGIASETLLGTAKFLPTLVKTGVGLAGYQALSMAEDKITQIVTGKTQSATQAISSKLGLTPEGSATLDLLDMVAKGGTLYGVYKAAPSVIDSFTKDMITQHGLPQYTFIDAAKVKDMFQTGALTSVEEKGLVSSLGLNGDQYKQAFKEGLTIKLPTTDVMRVTDKPYWGKVKSILGFNQTDTSTTVQNKAQTTNDRILDPSRQLPTSEMIQAELAKGKGASQVIYEIAKDHPLAEAKEAVAQAQAATPEPEQAAAPAAPQAGQLPATDDTLLDKTPADIQKGLAGVQQTADSKIADIQKQVAAAEKAVEAAAPKSAEKKDAKIRLSDAKEALAQAQQAPANIATQHANEAQDTLSNHIQNEHGVPEAQAGALAAKTLEHVTNPELLKKHGGTPLRRIAAAVVKNHELTSAKTFGAGDSVSIKGTASDVLPDGEYKVTGTRRSPKGIQYKLENADGKSVFTTKEVLDNHGTKLAPKKTVKGGNFEDKDPTEKVPEHVEAKAQTDWEDHYAEDAAKRFEEIHKVQTELKDAKIGDRAALKSRLDKLVAEDVKIEDEFLAKWRKVADKALEKNMATHRAKLAERAKEIDGEIEKLKKSKSPAAAKKITALEQEKNRSVKADTPAKSEPEWSKTKEAYIKYYEDTYAHHSITGFENFARTSESEHFSFDEAVQAYKEANAPKTAEAAAKTYYDDVITRGKEDAVIIDTDLMRKYFGDYDKDRRVMYSKAMQLVLDRALKENPEKEVMAVGGGSGSGKSEFLTKGIVANGFKGIVYDSTMSDPAAVARFVEKVRAADKTPIANLIIVDPENARLWTLVREAETGRPVEHDFFVKAHTGYPATVLKLAELGVETRLIDGRGKTSDEVRAEVAAGEFEKVPLDIINKMDYNENTVRAKALNAEQRYAQNTNQQQEASERPVPERGVGGNGKALGQNAGDTEKVSADKEEVNASQVPEKVPREKKEKTPIIEETPIEPLKPEEMMNMAAAIEKGKPKGWIKTALNEIATAFNPVGQADRAAVDAIMARKGEYEQQLFRTERTMRAIKDMWDKQPESAALDFMDKVETGNIDELPKEMQDLARMYRTRLDNTRAAALRFKNVNFLENFFPHFWKEAKAVEEANLWAKANAKRPFQGNKSFTKERVFATIQDGVKAGYELITHNPEELVQLYEQNVGKFVMAQSIHADLKARGFSRYLTFGAKPPADFTRIEDSITKVYGNPNIPILEAYDEHVFNGLQDVLRDLDIEHSRSYKIGGKGVPQGTLGYTSPSESKITTKFGSPLSVIAHELGHQLDYKYNLKEAFKADPDRTFEGETDQTQKELRALADLRYEGHDVTDSYKNYVRSAPEKMAVMLEAYVHAPEKFKEVAPRTYEKFEAFLNSHAELRPITKIKPSLVMGVREDSVSAGGAVIRGEWYVQKDVARLINNFLSTDKLMDTAWGKGIMNTKNTMNALELGFSAFHLTMETLDSMITKFGIGLSKISTGDLTGFADMAISPLAPATFFRSGQKFYNGDPEMLAIEKDLFKGGASLRSRQYYKNSIFDTFTKTNRELMGQIKRGEILKGAKGVAWQVLRLPLTAVEATLRPAFAYYIPRLKVGAFRDLFASELVRNSQRIQDGRMTRAELARNVWNNVENRMGELNYDNLFWNRNFKTALMLSTRAVGWNLGTVRELGGGFFQDLPKSFGATKESREDFKKYGFDFTPKMAYTFSLFFMLAIYDSVYQYLHTGKYPGENDDGSFGGVGMALKDMYYPRNGAKTTNGDDYRVSLPTYLKDIAQSGVPSLVTGHPFAAFDDASSMIKNKAAPELSTIFDIAGNRDFYGNEIRNPNDNTPTQLKQLAIYLVSQLEPFSFQQLTNLSQGKATTEQKAEAFLGIVKAPTAIIESDYEQQLNAIYQNQDGLSGAETPEQAAAYSKKQAVVDQIKKGNYSGVQALVDEGIVKPSGLRQFLEDAALTTPQKEYKGLSPENKAALMEQ